MTRRALRSLLLAIVWLAVAAVGWSAESEKDAMRERQARGEVRIMGAVNQPMTIKLAKGEKLTLVEAIARAGGFHRISRPRQTYVTRIDAAGEVTRVVVDCSGKDMTVVKFELKAGDLVYALEPAI